MADAPENLAATIVLPTHDHGPTLYCSVRSALEQTVPVEVFIIGDGATEETRAIARELENADDRVRFFDHPKSPSRGEMHRHEALKQARGRVVCYLSDDDLYLPHHCEDMCRLLDDADFAHALPVEALPDGGIALAVIDLAMEGYRREILGERNRLPLSAGAHTVEAYWRLDRGWTSAPPGISSDLYMWRKWVSHPGCRFRAATRPSVLVFPSPKRRHLSNEARMREMQEWAERYRGERGSAQLTEQVLAVSLKDAAALEALAGEGAGTLAWPPSLQVFYPRPESYAERFSAVIPLRPRVWDRISLRFPYPAGRYSIRIDPSSRPGLIEVANIAVHDPRGNTLWELTPASAAQIRVEGTGVALTRQPLTVVSDGDDPRLILPPLELTRPTEVELAVELRLDAESAKLARLLAGHVRAVQSKRVSLRRAFDRLFRRSGKT